MASLFERRLLGSAQDFLDSISVSPEQIAAIEQPAQDSGKLIDKKRNLFRPARTSVTVDPGLAKRVNDALDGASGDRGLR